MGTISFNDAKYSLTAIYTATSGGTVFSSDLDATAAFDYFDDAPVVDDALYFGASSSYFFGTLVFNIGTAMAGTDIDLVWEYSSRSDGWVEIPNSIDETTDFTTLGSQEFRMAEPPEHWYTTVNGSNLKWVRCRLRGFTTVSEGGANITDVVKNSRADVQINSYTDVSPCTYTDVYNYLNTNHPEAGARLDTSPSGTYTQNRFFFENVKLYINSRLYTTNEMIFLGNDSFKCNFTANYLQSGDKVGDNGYKNPSHHFIANFNTGQSIVSTDAATKWYGGTLGFWGRGRRGFLSISNGDYVGLTVNGASGYIHAPPAMTNSGVSLTHGFNFTGAGAILNGMRLIDTGSYLWTCFNTNSTPTEVRDMIWAYPTTALIYINYWNYDNVRIIDPIPSFPDHATFPIINRANYTAADLTGFYFYDTVAGTFTDYTTAVDNGVATGAPLSGEVGDYYYILCSGSVTSRAIPTFYFDITDQSNDYEYVWEYYNSGAWYEAPVRGNTSNFTTTGREYCPWGYSQNTVAVNGVTGYWWRIKIKTKGTDTPTVNYIRCSRQSGTGIMKGYTSDSYQYWGGTEEYSLDMKVIAKDGTELDGATITITDVKGNAVSESPMTTDANGSIYVELVRRKYTFSPETTADEPETDDQIGTDERNPYTFVISKDGYETKEFEIVMDTKRDMTTSLETAIDSMVILGKGVAIKADPTNNTKDRDLIII